MGRLVWGVGWLWGALVGVKVNGIEIDHLWR